MNIVFDLGGVVFNWQPDAIIQAVFSDSGTQKLVKDKIFDHADWVELDRGTITFDQAASRGASRTGLPRQIIETLLNEVPVSLTPIQATIDLLCSIRNSGNRFFVLSNMHVASFSYLKSRHNIWDMFEGIVISSQIQKVKPEIEIYEHLLNEYALSAAETVFIDDMQENVEAAASIGINTIRFENADQCRKRLGDLGCI